MMDSQWVLDWSHEALRLALILSLPVRATARVSGILLGILQTVMQLNDGAFAQVPRMVVVGLSVMMLLPWMIAQWVSFTTSLISSVSRGG